MSQRIVKESSVTRRLVARRSLVNRTLLGLLIVGCALSHPAVSLAGLLGHWTLDEGSGQTVGDSVSSNDGTRGLDGSVGTDDPAWTSSSIIGSNALDFDGSNDWANFGDVLDQGTSDFTISLWLNADAALTTAASGGRLFQKRGTGSIGTQAGWQVVASRSGSDVLISNTLWEDGDGVGNSFYINPTSSDEPSFTIGQTGDWIHLVSVFDNTNDKWIFYADGVEVKNLNISSLIGSVDNTRSLAFGAADTTNTQFFNGNLDDLGMFDQTLTPAEARAIYTLGDDTDPLGNGADLNYNLSNAQSLFDLHDAGSGSVEVDGVTWYFRDNLTTGLGALTKTAGDYFLLLDVSGTGVATVQHVPEPSSLLLLGLGVLGMVRHTRRRRRRA